jgi:hypothetical protein
MCFENEETNEHAQPTPSSRFCTVFSCYVHEWAAAYISVGHEHSSCVGEANFEIQYAQFALQLSSVQLIAFVNSIRLHE